MTTQCSNSTVENGDVDQINKQHLEHVRVSPTEDTEAVFLPLEDDNTLLLSTVCARFPSVSSLKYLNPQSQGYRVLRLMNGHFYPPQEKDNKWPDTVFYCVFPKESRHRESEKSVEEDIINQLSNSTITDNPCSRQSHNKTKSNPHQNGNSTILPTSANLQSRDLIRSGRHTPTDLIVLGLSTSTSDDSLRNYFSRFGDVVMAQVKRNPHTQESRGFGFIRFSDTGAQDIALKDTHLIDERMCRVRVPNSKFEADKQEMDYKIHIRGITEQMTVSVLREYFSQHGTVDDVFVPRPFRNFAFITFRQTEPAARLIGRELVIQGTRVSIGSAAPKMSGYSGSGRRNSHLAAQPPAPLLSSSLQTSNISSHPPSSLVPTSTNSCSTASSSPPLTANFSDPNSAMAALYAYLFAVSSMSPMIQPQLNGASQYSDQQPYSQSQTTMQQRSLPPSAAASYDALTNSVLYGWALANHQAAAGYGYGLPTGSSYFSSPGTLAYAPVNAFYPVDHNIPHSSVAAPTPLMESYAWMPELYYSGSNVGGGSGGAPDAVPGAVSGTNNGYLVNASQTISQPPPCFVDNILGVSGSMVYSPNANGSNGSTNDTDLSVSNPINSVQTLHSLPGIPPVVNEALAGAH